MSRDLEPDDFAGVWSERAGYSFLVPIGYTDKTDIPEKGTALIAAMIRLEADAEFRQDCINWLKARRKS
jgi:hypothetical protein